MREFAKISADFWIGPMGKKIKNCGLEAKVIAFYLMTCRHANMIGFYYLPLLFIMHETGIPLEGVSKGLKSLIGIEFCSYDDETECVWIHDMAATELGITLKKNDNRVKHINNVYKKLPVSTLQRAFYERYGDSLFLDCPPEAPFKPHRSQEKKQEQEQEQKQDKKQDIPIIFNGEQKEIKTAENKILSTEKFISVFSNVDQNPVFTVPLRQGKTRIITKNELDEWQKSYSDVDVHQEIRHLIAWNQANPDRQKTERGVNRHWRLVPTMKRITDPALIKELDALSETNTSQAIPQTLQNPIQGSANSNITNNPVFNFLTGAGGGIQNVLADLPYSPIPKAPPSQGVAGGIGNIAGNIASFLGGGELLESTRALSEGLPMLGHLAKSLAGEGLAGIARRITGSSIGGALENPDDRTRGAVKGALLGSAAESTPVLGTQLLKIPEKINPKQYTSNLADSIRSAYNQTKDQSEANYNAVMNKVGTYPVDHPNLLYPVLNKKFMRAYGAGESLLHEDYITKPTVEKAHFLQSQIGHKIRKLQANPDKDPATINAIDDLNTVRRSLLSDLSSALQRVDPIIAKEYHTAGEFHRKNVVPFEQNNVVRDVSEGDTNEIQPRALLKALTKLTQSDKKGVPNDHFLNTTQSDLKKHINQGKLLKDIVTGGTGAAIGMAIHPGLWPAALGLAGGGFFGHYGLPRLLRIAENPEAKLDRLHQPYRLLANSLMANLLPQSQETTT